MDKIRVLFIVPKANRAGGVAKVLSMRANYFCREFGYEVGILTQNEGHENPFFAFDSRISFFDIKLKKNLFFLFHYKKQVEKIQNQFKPDVILLLDNGLKAFLFPFFIKKTCPVVFEIHASKWVVEFAIQNYVSKIKYSFQQFIRNFGIRKHDNIVYLSKLSEKEWNKKGEIISNPIVLSNHITNVNQKRVLCITRNSYEKGVDQLLEIWSQIESEFLDWSLYIFIENEGYFNLESLKNKFNTQRVVFNAPTLDVEKEYLSSSIFAMTSRQEGMPMVLLEASNYGVPIIAYDCPVGPASILTKQNGILIENNNSKVFAENLSHLMSTNNLRDTLSKQAKESSKQYDINRVALKWKVYLESLIAKQNVPNLYKSK